MSSHPLLMMMSLPLCSQNLPKQDISHCVSYQTAANFSIQMFFLKETKK